MSKSFERRTSWKVIVTNLFVIALCGAMFYYIFKLQGSIQNQRVNINVQNDALDLTNRFTQLVHEAQSEANLFAFTDNPKHLKRFGELNNEISACADSILLLMPTEKNKERILEIERLILRKGQISYVLSRQFYYYDPLAEIDAKLKAFTPPAPPVFEEQEGDTLAQANNAEPLTVSSSIDIVNDLMILSEKARSEYKKRIKEYEKKTAELITDDNHLSEEIADLLLALNQEIVESTKLEMEISENIINEHLTASTYIGGAVLISIVFFVILILNDVSKGLRARKAAEKARADAEEAKKKTEELMESRHKMLLSVSHDIKSPLTSIIGNLELMDNTGNEKEVASIQQSADHILKLLGNLLEFSSLEQGMLQAEKKPFNVSQLCEETASMFEPIAHKKNLVFDFKNEIQPNLYANSDQLKIKQIISNLISNAIKYTIEGSIGFRASYENGNLVFRIQDTGIGIPDDKLEDIFKPFVRTDSGSKISEGSGYGLSVVKGFVDLLGGQIEVESKIGQGSLFTTTIPVEIEIIESTDDQSHPAEVTTSTKQVEQRRILIIDDDDTLLTVISNMISRLGHQVLICRSKNDIDEALHDTGNFDYVLTDREMGALSGNDILKIFKKADPSKPVYLMTARMDYDKKKAKSEGFDGFLQKPFNLKKLESIFGRHTQEEERSSTGSMFSDFPELCDMMGDDEEAIRGILNIFAQSTADHLVALNECVEQDDFSTAHSLCHKMLPMFIQLQRENDIPFLTKMNNARGISDPSTVYPKWKDDAVKFMDDADQLLEMLSEKYDIN